MHQIVLLTHSKTHRYKMVIHNMNCSFYFVFYQSSLKEQQKKRKKRVKTSLNRYELVKIVDGLTKCSRAYASHIEWLFMLLLMSFGFAFFSRVRNPHLCNLLISLTKSKICARYFFTAVFLTFYVSQKGKYGKPFSENKNVYICKHISDACLSLFIYFFFDSPVN